MSHGLTISDSMFSADGKMPWHRRKECVVLPEGFRPQSVIEALTASGLGWAVENEPAYRRVLLPDGEGGSIETFVPVIDADDTGWKLNVRSDTGAVVGVVTEDYRVIQNIDAFRFVDALLGGGSDEETEALRDVYRAAGWPVPEGPVVEWETAGSLSGGKRVWVLARIPEAVEMAGDVVLPYLFMANTHDGSGAATAGATGVRIVCRNTFNYALGSARNVFRIRHTGNVSQKLNDAKTALGIQLRWTNEMKAIADRLGLVSFSDRKAEKLIRDLSVTKIEEGMGDRAVRNRETTVAAIMSIYKGEGPQGDTRGAAPGTAWTLLQAVGEHADYGRRYTVRTSQVSRSFEDKGLRQEALDKILAAV